MPIEDLVSKGLGVQVAIACIIGLLIIALIFRSKSKSPEDKKAKESASPEDKNVSTSTTNVDKLYSAKSYFVTCEQGAAIYCGSPDDLRQGSAEEVPGRLQTKAELKRINDVSYIDNYGIENGFFTVEFAPLNKDAIGKDVYIELSLVSKASDVVDSSRILPSKLDAFMEEFGRVGMTDDELANMYTELEQLISDDANQTNKWNEFQSLLKDHGVYAKYKEAQIAFEPDAKWTEVKRIFSED